MSRPSVRPPARLPAVSHAPCQTNSPAWPKHGLVSSNARSVVEVSVSCIFNGMHFCRSSCGAEQTRKRGSAQRVARPACANATVHFLLTYRLAMLLPSSEWRLKTNTEPLAYVRSHHAHQDLRGYWTKVYQICSPGNFFINGLLTCVLRGGSAVGSWTGDLQVAGLILGRSAFT